MFAVSVIQLARELSYFLCLLTWMFLRTAWPWLSSLNAVSGAWDIVGIQQTFIKLAVKFIWHPWISRFRTWMWLVVGGWAGRVAKGICSFPEPLLYSLCFSQWGNQAPRRKGGNFQSVRAQTWEKIWGRRDVRQLCIASFNVEGPLLF